MKHGHHFISTASYTIILAVGLSVMDLQHVFIIFGAQAFAMMVFSFEKNVIKAPRPFFVDPDIPVEACKFAEFGSPSGHSFAASTIYTNVTALILKYYKSSRKTSILAFSCITAPIVLFTGVSRVYEGMHSVDQVLSGIVQGAIVAYLFAEVLYEYMLDLFDHLGELSYFQVVVGNAYGLTMFLGNVASLILYFYSDSNYTVPEEWLTTIQTKCPELKAGEQNPILQSLEYSMISLGTFGSLMGISFEAKVFGSNKYKAFNKTSVVVSVLRTIVMVAG